MAKIKSKGTKLQLSIASVFTDIAAVKSLQSPKGEVQSFMCTALDSGVGMEHQVTGYSEGGSVSGTLYFDPTAATHKAFTTRISTPTDGDSWKIIWSDGSATVWPFTGFVKSFGPVRADINEGLQAEFEVKLNGLVTYP